MKKSLVLERGFVKGRVEKASDSGSRTGMTLNLKGQFTNFLGYSCRYPDMQTQNADKEYEHNLLTDPAFVRLDLSMIYYSAEHTERSQTLSSFPHFMFDM